VPIGSGDWVRRIVLDGLAERQKPQTGDGVSGEEVAAKRGVTFDVVSNPEFLREGCAVHDTFNPDRIVLGSNSQRAMDMMLQLYRPIVDRKFAEDPSLPDGACGDD
jgi:Predicted UDP-glucose 6-dehydrogenase